MTRFYFMSEDRWFFYSFGFKKNRFMNKSYLIYDYLYDFLYLLKMLVKRPCNKFIIVPFSIYNKLYSWAINPMLKWPSITLQKEDQSQIKKTKLIFNQQSLRYLNVHLKGNTNSHKKKISENNKINPINLAIPIILTAKKE
jgi:hypothetical protein